MFKILSINFAIISLFSASCSSSTSSNTLKSGGGSSNATEVALERKIMNLVEQKRRAAGHTPATHHEGFSVLARQHNENMAKKYEKKGVRVLNHDGFRRRSSKMIVSYGMGKTGENTAYITRGYADEAGTILEGWLNSKSHRENIYKDWDNTGVGVTRTSDGTIYATQLFGKKPTGPVYW